MARRKKPEGENKQEATIRQQLEFIANSANRSEKVSWERKLESMQVLVNKLIPLENQILDLMASKLPILDEVAEIRAEMVLQCIHPYEHLLHKDDHIECKFCNRKIGLSNGKTKA